MDPPDPKELRDQLEPRVLVELLVLLELWVFMEKEVINKKNIAKTIYEHSSFPFFMNIFKHYPKK